MNSISAKFKYYDKAAEKASKVLIRDFGEIEKLQVSKKVLKILLLIRIIKQKKLLLKNLQKQNQIIHLLVKKTVMKEIKIKRIPG